MIIEKLIYIWKGHITNWPWRARLDRRNIRNMARTRMQMKYLDKYISFTEQLIPTTHLDKIKEPEKAFTIWLQGFEEAPDIVKECIRSLKSFYGDNLIILDAETVLDYLELPDFIIEKWKSGKMLPAHFSDILRIELLHKFGGYWFDATDFMTGNIPEVIREADFFMFLSSQKLLIHTFVQNYFIRAKKGDPLLDMWRSLVLEYWRNEDQAISYYLVQHLFRFLIDHNTEARHLFNKMPKIELDNTQRIWHEIGNDPFDQKIFDEMCKQSFLQKCTYKKKTGIIREIIPGSMADALFNGKR